MVALSGTGTGSLPDLTGLPPEMIMKLGDSSAANAAMFANTMRGGFQDKLLETRTSDELLNSENLRNYRDATIALSTQANQLSAMKANLEYALKFAKNEAEVAKIQALMRKYDIEATKAGLMAKQLNMKINAISNMQQAGTNPAAINMGDMAAAGFRPPVPNTSDAIYANDYARKILYDDEGKVKEDLSQSDIESASRALQSAGQNLGVIELQPVEYQNWLGKRTTAPGRKLYFIAPQGGLGKMDRNSFRQFMEELRVSHDIDEDDPLWKVNVQKYFGNDNEWMVTPKQ